MRASIAHRMHHDVERFEFSLRSAFISAGTLLLTVITILILFFGVFLSRSN